MNTNDRYEILRKVLFNARQEAGLTQIQVAERLGKPQSFISKYELGERQLDVVEFLQVCRALGYKPGNILNVINNKPVQNSILHNWDITEEELTMLVEQNPSLRGVMLGYCAELKFHQMFLNHPEIAEAGKSDDHDRKKKGDRNIIYKNHEFIVEVKSLQSNLIKKEGDLWVGKSQVDASDSRDVIFKDGSKLKTTCLLRDEFDLLTVNCFAFEQKWRFVFAKNSDLPPNTFKKYTQDQRAQLLPTLITVTWPPQPPFYDDPFPLLDELVRERG